MGVTPITELPRKELEKKLKRLQHNHNALVTATQLFEDKAKEKDDRISYLEKCLANAERQLVIAKKVMQDTLMQHNLEAQESGNEILKLQKKLKMYED